MIDQIENYLTNRRQQFQDWESNPPHFLGFGIFTLVVLEIVLSRRLFSEAGLRGGFFSQIVTTAFFLLGAELILATLAKKVAQIFKKTGQTLTTLTFFNIGLLPLLLILPVSVVSFMGKGLSSLQLFVVILLSLKVLGNWREAVQVSFEF